MRSKFIDLAICQHDNDTRKFLFRVPCYNVVAGDRVIVETSKGNKYANVLAVHSVWDKEDDPEYQFIVTAMGATSPLKRIITKIHEINVDWSDYEEETAEPEVAEEKTTEEGGEE